MKRHRHGRSRSIESCLARDRQRVGPGLSVLLVVATLPGQTITGGQLCGIFSCTTVPFLFPRLSVRSRDEGSLWRGGDWTHRW